MPMLIIWVSSQASTQTHSSGNIWMAMGTVESLNKAAALCLSHSQQTLPLLAASEGSLLCLPLG